jgi:replicative DNA helicase
MSEQLYSMNAGNFVLSSLLNNTNLLYNSAYPLSKDDFKPNLSHKIVYISICQLADRGCSVIDAKELVTYLEGGYEEQLNSLKADLSDGNVIEYIDTLKTLDNDKSYTYWYNEVRKRSLLRQYRDSGFDISEFWDENKNEEKNVAKLNNISIKDIVHHFDAVQTKLRQQFIVEETVRRIKAGENYEAVKEAFKNIPYFGACMVGAYQTTLYRGWLKGQLIVNSAGSGMGKTIRAVGELCNVCALALWDDDKQDFVVNPNCQGSGLYINTEMDLELELTPCFLAYISNVPRYKIMDGRYDSKEEEERVDVAIKILRDSNIFLIDDPNFTLRSIEDNIKYYKETYNIQYMVFDYIQDNGCVGKEMHQTHDVIARDTIILNIASNLKVWTRQYDIGIYTMTQLNGNEKTAEIIDEGCLSGGNAIKNKLDAGCISLYPRKKEQKFTEGLLAHWLSQNRSGKFGEDFKPNVVLHNYKVRFSKYGVGIKIYQYLDKSTGRCVDMFCTDAYDNPINIDKTIIKG